MRDRERGDDQDEGAQAPEGDHEAQQEQQVVRPVEDVEEAEGDEPKGGLMPSRIQPDQARIAGQLEGPDRASGREEPKDGHHPQPQPPEPGMDGEPRSWRAYRVLEPQVEQALVPIELRPLPQRRRRGRLRRGLDRLIHADLNASTTAPS